MKVQNISPLVLNDKDKLHFSYKIANTESKLYKTNIFGKEELIKIFYQKDNEEYMKDKIYILDNLITNKDLIDIENLLLPNSLISIDNKIVGYKMDYIKHNLNLATILSNDKISLRIKLILLKKIYTVLDKSLKIKGLEGKFFLNDIHESNIIYDTQSEIIRIVDMDSSYINNSKIYPTKYFCVNTEMKKHPNKYPIDQKEKLFIPNNNTVLVSYIFMLLNTISEDLSYNWNKETLLEYLNLLNSKEVSYKLTDDLLSIYDDSDNISFDIDNLNCLNPNNNYSIRRLSK